MEERLIYESTTEGFVVTTHTFTQLGTVLFRTSSACYAMVYKLWIFGSPKLLLTGPQYHCDPTDISMARKIAFCGQQHAEVAHNPMRLEIGEQASNTLGINVEMKILHLQKICSELVALALNSAFKKADGYWRSAVMEQEVEYHRDLQPLKKL